MPLRVNAVGECLLVGSLKGNDLFHVGNIDKRFLNVSKEKKKKDFLERNGATLA